MLAVGEVLWDRFAGSARLGGAPLNFAAHLKRLRQDPLLVSAVGDDDAGRAARNAISGLGLDTSFVQSTARYGTGTAIVTFGPREQTSFAIARPAAYDAIALSGGMLQALAWWNPRWLYYGTLFSSCRGARDVLDDLLDAVPCATRFYDLNLRPGFESPDLVRELLRQANVVQLNERELRFVHAEIGLPGDPERFCAHGCDEYGWRAACVTLGARGCAMRVGGEYVEAEGYRVVVADTVGAGDAFAAAFVHGLASNWPTTYIADFSNRAGAFVAGVHGAIPDSALDTVFDS